MNQSELVESLPAPLRKHLDSSAPLPARMMAAKGLVPLPPRDMVVVMCGFALDADEKIQQTARGSLSKLPDKVLGPALDSGLPPPVLGVLATCLLEAETLLERVILDRNTPDEALAEIAPHVSDRVAEILVSNQERCMRSEALVKGICQNANIMRSSLDRLFDFLVRAGVIFEDMPQFADALARLSPSEIQEAAENVQLPTEVEAFIDEPETEEVTAASEASPRDAEQATKKPDRMPVLKLINGLNVAQKVALALKGNKEARMILVRDSNRVVAGAAIRSPRITDPEVIAAAQSRSVSDEVIRIIAGSKDMVRAYGVKIALVNNPKTPLPTAMRFLPLLRASDLKAVSKSKNIPSALVKQAKRLLLNKGTK